MHDSYQFTASDADIILRTPEPKLFQVHKNILSIASPVFRDMLAGPQSTKEAERAPPIVDVQDSAQDLEILLRMIYPVAFIPITDLNALSNALVILDKYNAEGLQDRLKSHLISSVFLATDPMRVYAIACRWDFKKEAEIAAPHAAAVGVSAFTCVDDMRYISGLDYHRIMLLVQERREFCRKEILSKPVPCEYCSNEFYDNLRPRLAERLFVGNEMFCDPGSCMEVCFDVVKKLEEEQGGGACVSRYGRSHLGQFMVSLAKSLKSIPADKGNMTA